MSQLSYSAYRIDSGNQLCKEGFTSTNPEKIHCSSQAPPEKDEKIVGVSVRIFFFTFVECVRELAGFCYDSIFSCSTMRDDDSQICIPYSSLGKSTASNLTCPKHLVGDAGGDGAVALAAIVAAGLQLVVLDAGCASSSRAISALSNDDDDETATTFPVSCVAE